MGLKVFLTGTDIATYGPRQGVTVDYRLRHKLPPKEGDTDAWCKDLEERKQRREEMYEASGEEYPGQFAGSCGWGPFYG